MFTNFLKTKLLIFLILCVCMHASGQSITYTADWRSLKQYKVPDWFRDAKFGIFMHWGVQSVPEHENGWYARHMYMQDSAEFSHTYDYHVKHYGHPSQFGYKDLIPLWKAEKFDPDSLVRLYKKIGARYVVPVAVHHDNFDNYNSSFQPWNSVNMGPKKDIIGMWAASASRYGMRFGVSSHTDRSWSWLSTSHGADKKGPLKGISYDGNLTKADGKGKWWEGYDPADLYSRNHGKGEAPDAAYATNWFNRTKELIDKYHPDLLYFDGPLPINCTGCQVNRKELENYGLRIASHFYNSNMQWHNGKMEAVLNIKSYGGNSIPYPGAVVVDFEKGQAKTILTDAWQTDTSLPTGWFYDSRPPELSDTVLIHNLCDIVSKNGNLLLNVALRADGSLPDEQVVTLENIGKWLKLNGEAIYGTRPWKIFGEGPTLVQSGHFKQNVKPFTAQDIRFTAKGQVLYAIVLGWPTDRKLSIQSLAQTAKTTDSIKSISMIGEKAPVKWSQSEKGANVLFPEQKPGNYAYVLKIIFKN